MDQRGSHEENLLTAFLFMNKNYSITCGMQIKQVIKGKFIALNISIRQYKKTQVNCLNFHFKKLKIEDKIEENKQKKGNNNDKSRNKQNLKQKKTIEGKIKSKHGPLKRPTKLMNFYPDLIKNKRYK